MIQGADYFNSVHFPHAPFLPAITRDCPFAYKPSPEALLHICDTWGIPPGVCMMVGDSVKDDIVCGNRAGAITVLLDIHRNYSREDGTASDSSGKESAAAAGATAIATAVVEGDGRVVPLVQVAAERAQHEALVGEQRPHYVVHSLSEFQEMLQQHFQLVPPTASSSAAAVTAP